jgi:hypothetical protein
MVVAGIVGCAVLPPFLARRGAERAFMRGAVLTSALGCAALGAFTMLGARAGVITLMGFVMLPALPVILAAAERLAGSAAGTAGAIVWMAGNLGGLVVGAGRPGPRPRPLGGVPRHGGRLSTWSAARCAVPVCCLRRGAAHRRVKPVASSAILVRSAAGVAGDDD